MCSGGVLGDNFGNPSRPGTQLVIRLLTGFSVGISVSLFIAFYGREVVFGLQLVDYLLFAVLAMLVHMVVHHM